MNAYLVVGHANFPVKKCRSITLRRATPHLLEKDIKARFLAALNKLLEGKDALPEDCRLMQTALTDCSAIDAELDGLLQEIEGSPN